MFLTRFFRPNLEKKAVHAAYVQAVTAARMPIFYEKLGIPDTVDGRFEMIALHVFLILHRIRADADATAFGQRLYDLFFMDMDRSLREMGTGDLSVGKQIRAMAQALYGRIRAYQTALSSPDAMQSALMRNLYGTVESPSRDHLTAVAAYIDRQIAALDQATIPEILAGNVPFVD